MNLLCKISCKCHMKSEGWKICRFLFYLIRIIRNDLSLFSSSSHQCEMVGKAVSCGTLNIHFRSKNEIDQAWSNDPQCRCLMSWKLSPHSVYWVQSFTHIPELIGVAVQRIQMIHLSIKKCCVLKCLWCFLSCKLFRTWNPHANVFVNGRGGGRLGTWVAHLIPIFKCSSPIR